MNRGLKLKEEMVHVRAHQVAGVSPMNRGLKPELYASQHGLDLTQLQEFPR